MNSVRIDLLCQDFLKYISGRKRDFSEYELDLSYLTEFEQMVLNETRKIPYGETITYSELAKRIKKPGASQAVGNALSKNPYPIVIPCHRVVSKSGLGGFGGGFNPQKLEEKKKLIEIEKNYKKNKT
ncbi:methylated-DNA--[protein]-cysteine S-methyltransferase [Methanohalobium sp.]|uniref:methylated-DNA--[protein]-cysteine S-methyltransferase n=1 Tax=Methanohalobium sp. TaxID=2837493 RepID=UPI0025E256CA|nr:methylated-DNA--[protein]-cysteine S-methyltransferase [Methanohalobium sp.]